MPCWVSECLLLFCARKMSEEGNFDVLEEKDFAGYSCGRGLGNVVDECGSDVRMGASTGLGVIVGEEDTIERIVVAQKLRRLVHFRLS